MSGPIKHNATGLWVDEKKKQLRGQRRRADLSCIFMWLEGSMTAVSENCGQRQNSLCSKRQLKKSKPLFFFFLFNYFFSLTISKCQCHRPTMDKAVCARKWLPKPQLQLFFSPFTPSANLDRKVFSVKWCSAEWQTNRAMSPLARAHFSILDISFSLQLA